MKVVSWILAVFAVVGLLVISQAAPAGAEEMTPKVLFETRCSKCHPYTRAWDRYEKPDFWQQTVTRMKGKRFSGISDQDAEIIIQYLTENRSKN